tara:strand:+ start:798 stop:1001 length:204 start_codon:yes stop_codon:yes gene_type:complete
MNLGGDTTTLDLCKRNPEWFAGYTQALGHARQFTVSDGPFEHLYTEYLSILLVVTGKTPTEMLEEEE